MNKKTLFILLALVAALALGGLYYRSQNLKPGSASKNEPRRYVIGVIRAASIASVWDGFRAAMPGLGYEEGKNIEYKIVESGKDLAENKTKVQELMAAGADLVLTLGVTPSQAARDATAQTKPDLPVVFISSDPVGAKLVQSMRSSGNNLTGVSLMNEILAGKRLELLLEMVPEAKRVVFFWNDPNTSGLDAVKKSAEAHQIPLAEKQVKTSAELSAMLDTFRFAKNDVFLRASDSLSGLFIDKMVSVVIKNKIPMAGIDASNTQRGALMSYGANLPKVGEQAAIMADKILKGSIKPSEIPVESPAAFDLSVNLKTASEIGLRVSNDFLSQANLIIK